MKKKQIIMMILSLTLLTGGCAATKETEESKESTATVQEQIANLSNEFKNYIATPTMSDYVLVADGQMNPVLTETEASFILEVQNSGKEAYENMEITVLFYDNEDKIAASSNLFMPLILPDVKQMYSFSKPQTKEGLAIAYDHYEFQFKALSAGTELINYSDKVELVSNKDSNDAVLAKITNTSGQTLTSVTTYILYYKDGKLIDCSENNVYNLLPNEYEVLYFQGPYGLNYSILPFDEYKVYVAAAVTASVSDDHPMEAQ